MGHYYYNLGNFSMNGYYDSFDRILEIIDLGVIKTKKIFFKSNELVTRDTQLYCKKDENEKIPGHVAHRVSFIISSDIDIERVERDGYITLDNVVGIAIPFFTLGTMIEVFPQDVDPTTDDKLRRIFEYAYKNNWLIADSNASNFVDLADNTIALNKNLKR